MIRNYEFYKKRYNWQVEHTDYLYKLLKSAKYQNIIDENGILNNQEDLIKLCICENELTTLKYLISPISYRDNGVLRYHYLIDFFTLISQGILDEFPESIMKNWLLENIRLKLSNPKSKELSIEETSKDIVILTNDQRKDILNCAYNLDYSKICKMKVKDVLARQIPGIACPITTEKDVIRYSEISTVYPSLDLFRKNIKTISNDTGGCYNDQPSPDSNELFEINILIDYDTLDENNKLMAETLIAKGFAHLIHNSYFNTNYLKIFVNASAEEELKTIISELMQITSSFTKQDILHGKLNPEDIMEKYLSGLHYLKKEDRPIVNQILDSLPLEEAILKAKPYFYIPFYYSEEEHTFWLSKDYYDKHLEYLSEQKKNSKNFKL